MFAHGQVFLVQADVFGAHDLEGLDILQHAVLMDAGFVQECVLADDGLVELHRKARHGGDAAGQVHDLGRVDAGLVGQDVIADFHRHDHLFQRGIACAFAKAVDGAFDLACARLHRRQRVGGRHAQIVVAMGGEDDRVRAGDAFQQHADDLGALERVGVADRVGDVDRGGPGLDRDFNNAAEVIGLGPGGIHRRPLDVVAQVAGMGHGFMDALCHLVHVQIRDGAVQRRGADEGMDARGFGVTHGFPAAVDILEVGAGEAADGGGFRAFGDLAHRVEITLGGDGKARLDDVDAHFIEQTRDFQLFGMGHGGAG